MEIPEESQKIAAENNFEIKGYRILAKPEQMRKPRLVKVGAIQNSIVLPTTAPLEKQREAIWQKITTIIKAAAAAGVNIICMQEAWSKFIFRICFNLSLDRFIKFLSIYSNALRFLYP